MEETKQIVEAILLVKNELHDLFWLIFWMCLLGAFSSEIKIRKE